jgi:cell division protein FtsQ
VTPPSNRRIPKTPKPAGPEAPPPAPVRSSRFVHTVRAILGGALVVGLSGGMAWAVRRHIVESPRFRVTDIVVTGQHQRTAETLQKEAELSKGVNVFTLNLDRARAQLLEDPWISEAVLARRLPGTLLVQVTERELGALVVLRQTYVASREGIIFKRFELADPTDLPIITGLDPDAVADDRAGAEATVRRALDLVSDFEHTGLGQRNPLQEIHVTRDGGFTLVIGKEGLSVALGSPPFRKKLEEAVRVTAELDRRGTRAQALMLDDEARPERVVVRTR